MARAKNYSDITKYGTLGYRLLQLLNNALYQQSLQNILRSGIAVPTFQAPRESPLKYLSNRPVASPILTNSGGQDWSGKSHWDLNVYTLDELEAMLNNPNEIRATNQPGAILLLNGVGKMIGLAGSTFLNSTVGLLAGLSQGLGNLINGGSFTEGLWNNAITGSLQDFNKAMEEWMPNYYTQKELEGPWYENIFTANFIGDKLLKNMGFTIGAIGAAYLTGGMGVGSLLGRGVQALGAGARAAEITSGIANRVINGLVSAAGEASIEAYNSVHDGMEKYNNELDLYYSTQSLALKDKYDADILRGIAVETALLDLELGLAQLEDNVNKARQEYMKTTTDNGNSVFGLNMALLTLSNNLEFGRAMKGGWGSQKMLELAYKKGSKDIARTIEGKVIGNTKADDIAFGKALALGKAGYTNIAEEPSKSLLGVSAVKNMLSEGSEEGSQNLVSSAAQMQAQAKAQKSAKDKGYIDYALDTSISNDMIDYTNALNHAWEENFGTAASAGWEEVALGALTGALGVPMVGRRSNGKLGLTWQGGFMEDYKDAKEGYERIDKAVEELNKTTDLSKIKKTFHRAVANVGINQTQRQALFDDDHYIFKNALLAGAVNTALTIRDGIDSGEAYRSMILELATNVTDKDIEEYKQAVIAETGNEEALKGKTNEEIRETIQGDFLKFNGMLNKVLDNYDTLKKNKKAKKLSDYAFEEVLYSRSLALNMQDRINQIEAESQKLNLDDPIDKEEFERNSKDLRRLEEDRKFLNNRVEKALNDPKAFNKIIDLKMNNFQKGMMAALLSLQTEAVKNARSMEDVAHIVSPLDEASMETVLEKAYSEGTDETRKHIDNFRKFQDDAEIVLVSIDNMFTSLEQQLKEAVQNSPEGRDMLNVLQLMHINDKRELREQAGEEPEDYTDEKLQEDLSDFDPISSQNLELLDNRRRELIEMLNDPEAPFTDEQRVSLVLSVNTLASVEENLINLIRLKAGTTDLINSLYQDITLRDKIGLNTSIADGIRLAIDTLERDGTLDPMTKLALLDTIDELKDNEKLQSVKDVIKKRKDELEKQRREKEKRDKEEAERKKKEAEEREKRLQEGEETKTEGLEPKPQQNLGQVNKYSISQLLDFVNETASPKVTLTDNVIKSGLDILVGDKSADRNADFPNTDQITSAWNHLKQLNMVKNAFDPNSRFSDDARKQVKEMAKQLIEAVDKGFVIYDDGAEAFLKMLNIVMNDEMLQWFTNYKATADSDNSIDDKKPLVDPPKIDGDPQPGDFAGNLFHEYEMLNKVEFWHKLIPIAEGKWDIIDEMYADGVRPQWTIDNVLGKIYNDNPHIQVRFLSTGKNIVYLGLKKEDIASYLPSNTNNMTIADTNDGDYVIIGTMGVLKKGNNRHIFDKLHDRLVKGFNDNEGKNKFYVDTELHTEINNYTSGESIFEIEGDTGGKYRFVKELLNNSTLNTNDLAFGVVTGNEEEGITRIKPIRLKEKNIYYKPDTLSTGQVYTYVQSGIPNVWVPVMLKTVSWNDITRINRTQDYEGEENPYLEDSTWYKEEILEPINTLFSDAEQEDKVAAIAKLRGNLLFNKKEAGSTFPYTIKYDENSNTVQYLAEKKWSIAESPQELIDQFTKLNPRVNIKTTILSTSPELYIEAGILQTDAKMMHTMKSTFYIKGLDEDLNVIDTKTDMSSEEPEVLEEKPTIIYVNNKTFYKKSDGIFYANDVPLNDEDAELVRKLQATLNFGQIFKDDNDKEYVILNDVVFEHTSRGYVEAKNKTKKSILNRYNKWVEEQQRKQNILNAENKKLPEPEAPVVDNTEEEKPSIAATVVAQRKRDTKGFKPIQNQPLENLGNSGNNDIFAGIKSKAEIYAREARINDSYFTNISLFLGISEEELEELLPDTIAEKIATKLISDNSLTPENIAQITEASEDKISEILDNIINCH